MDVQMLDRLVEDALEDDAQVAGGRAALIDGPQCGISTSWALVRSWARELRAVTSRATARWRPGWKWAVTWISTSRTSAVGPAEAALAISLGERRDPASRGATPPRRPARQNQRTGAAAIGSQEGGDAAGGRIGEDIAPRVIEDPHCIRRILKQRLEGMYILRQDPCRTRRPRGCVISATEDPRRAHGSGRIAMGRSPPVRPGRLVQGPARRAYALTRSGNAPAQQGGIQRLLIQQQILAVEERMSV